MVPALYDDTEKEGLISSIRTELTQQGLPDSREACWAAFVDKVRSNLHVVLAMSPVGDTLRSRCRNFPGLVNNTVINWFEPWPEQVGWRALPVSQAAYKTTVASLCLQTSFATSSRLPLQI